MVTKDAGAGGLALDLYRTMVRIRAFEERVGELFVAGGTAGSMLHLSIGEEGAAAGVAAAMGPDDTFTTHHRGHGIFLARGGDPSRMMAEIAGKADGYCRGKGGSMHIADMGLGHLGANAIVGGGIPVVVGAGLSHRALERDAVALAFFGDGALQQGILYEAMNMAALWRLPVLFVCVNNQYGMATRIDHAAANTDFPARARSFGLQGERVDGEDVLAVLETARTLRDLAREGRAGLLIVDCYRFYGHARKDKSPYRSEEEEAAGRGRDPIARSRARLLESGGIDHDGLSEISAAVAAEMDAAVAFAVAADPPASDAVFRDVYAPGAPAPTPVADVNARVLAE